MRRRVEKAALVAMSVLKLAPCATGSPHLTVQSVPAFRPTTTTTSSRSLQRSTVGRGAVPGRWRPRVVPVCQCASVPPQNPNPPPPAGAIAPTPVSFSSLSEYAHWCSNKLSIFLRVRHNRRISDQDSRGLLKTNTLEQG